jgi:hypothetical protein
MSRNEANESISVFPFISNYMGESNQQFRLLIDWTSAIYLNMRLETITLVNSFIFDKITTRRGTQFVPIGIPYDLLKMCPPNSTDRLSMWNPNKLMS